MNEIGKQPTSAVFKDSKEVSVDRMDEGNLLWSLIPLFIDLVKKILVLSFLLLLDFVLKLMPISFIPLPKDNDYHAEIHDSPDIAPLLSSKAKRLARKCNIIRENKFSVLWKFNSINGVGMGHSISF